MNIFQRTTLKSVQLIGDGFNPETSWNDAITAFSESEEMCKKSCPKHAFLGLLHAGLIKGLEDKKQVDSSENALYAIEAVRLLKLDPSLAENKAKLWALIENAPENYNNQLEPVLILWNEGLII